MKAQHGHHVIPKKLLLTVFGALVGLTILTGLTAQVDLGAFNVPLALLIAGSKATLVVTFFMALKYDSRVNTLVFLLGIIFVVVFLTFTLFDTAFRGDLGNVGSETISDIEAREAAINAQANGAQPAPMGQTDSTAAADTTAASNTSAAADTTAAADANADAGAEADSAAFE